MKTAVTAEPFPILNVEEEVLTRYGAGARTVEAGLCCPTRYPEEYLGVIPREIQEKDYGCGNPSRFVHENETVVDLGSGAGKICYILAQKVGRGGRVIGVDFNDEMLALARKYQAEIAGRLGYDNVAFVKARIQDLALSLDQAAEILRARPVASTEQWHAFEAECERLRRAEPLISNETADAVVSNCVLNLVQPQDKKRLFGELYRVLKNGGRAVISDVVCDEEPTPAILSDPKLWSGCIAGAFREDRFPGMFEEAGFHGIEILERQAEPWQVIDGIEFRSMTVRAWKGKRGPCRERRQAVVYKGPWKTVHDDDGHVYHRGQRAAVCDKTFRLMTNAASPYANQVVGIEPRVPVPPAEAEPFDCARDNTPRHPRETKGTGYRENLSGPAACCGTDGCC